MRVIVAVDPGLRGTGLAVFGGQTLHWAGYVVSGVARVRGPSAWYAMGQAAAKALVNVTPDIVVVEYPQARPKGKSRQGNARPSDVLELTGAAGALTMLFLGMKVRVDGVKPEGWKGQMTKRQDHRRTLHLISRTGEFERIQSVGGGLAALRAGIGRPDGLPSNNLDHNTMDAVGIGLWAVGRGRAMLPRLR